MARIRTVKPEFWTDSKVVGLSPLARLLFIGAWNFADDHGALEPDAVQLKLRVLPAEQCDPDELVAELLDAGLLRRTTNGDEEFWTIAGWDKHQKVDRRSSSQFGDTDSWSPAEASTSPAESPRIPPSPRDGREGKGKERKGESTRSRGSRRSPETPIPDDWQPTGDHHTLARQQGVDCDHEAAKFRDHAAANDRRQRDWDASFRTWLRRARDYGANGKARADPPARREPEVGSPEWEARQAEQQALEDRVLGGGR